MAQEHQAASDRSRSWMVAACCCFCNMTFYGISRLSGIMLVSATHTFNVSRAKAAVPFSLSTAMRNLAGVFVGHLGHQFGVGPVVAVGCFIASIGAGLCFFANDMQWLILCWGGVFGIGFGICTCLLPLAINQHFQKHSGTASGISYSGSYIGSFFFSPIIVSLLETFGLQGTFLIISGSILHVFIAALLFREPKSRKQFLKANVNSIFMKDKECFKGENISDIYKQSANKMCVDSHNALLNENNNSLLNNSVYLKSYRQFFNDFDNSETLPVGNSLQLSNVNNKSMHSEGNIHCYAFRRNFFKNFKFKSVYLENGEFCDNLKQKIPSILQTPSAKSFEIEACNSQNTDLSLIRTLTSNSTNCNTTFAVEKLNPKRRDIDYKIFSKKKSKAKYKLKLQKLKKVLIASLLNKTCHFKTECIQVEDVELTSFKYIQTLLYPNVSSIIVPTKDFNLLSTRSVKLIQTFIPMKTSLTSSHKEAQKEQIHSHRGLKEVKLLPSVVDTFEAVNFSLFPKIKCSSKPSITNNSESEQCDFSSSHNKRDTFTNFRYLDNSFERSSASNINNCISSLYNPSFYDHTPSAAISLSPELLLQHKVETKSLRRSMDSVDFTSPKQRRMHIPCWLRMVCEPIFIIISFTMSLQSLMVSCIVTTIEDFAADMGISEHRVHYTLMALSIANLVGTLTLGIITDRGLISRHRFLSLCFMGMALSLVAMSLLSVTLSSLLSLVAVYGLLESGVVITFPVLMREFVHGEKRQAVAVTSSNVLSAPTVMLVPMLIGHFRDNIGCYTGLFHLLGAISFTCSLVWLVAPSLCKRRQERRANIKR